MSVNFDEFSRMAADLDRKNTSSCGQKKCVVNCAKFNGRNEMVRLASPRALACGMWHEAWGIENAAIVMVVGNRSSQTSNVDPSQTLSPAQIPYIPIYSVRNPDLRSFTKAYNAAKCSLSSPHFECIASCFERPAGTPSWHCDHVVICKSHKVYDWNEFYSEQPLLLMRLR